MFAVPNTLAGVTLAVALTAGGVAGTPVGGTAPTAVREAASDGSPARVSAETVSAAIEEARAAGAVLEERHLADGSGTVVIEGRGGGRLEIGWNEADQRLGTGSDSYGGMYVAFNSFDQNLIISGAMTAIAAGMCALGPAVCAIANVAAVLASSAIGSSGGVRCGTKSLRVYPVSHKKPRCA